MTGPLRVSRQALMLAGCACVALLVTAVTHGAAPDQGGELARCHALDDTGKPTALSCYRELLAVADDDGVRAEALWRLGDTGAANNAFRRANDTNPGNADLLARWGSLYLAVHQAADAEALFAEALQIDPQHVEAQLGQVELLADRFEGRAQQLIQSILADEPDNARANALLARMQLEVGNVQVARKGLERLLESGAALGPRDRLSAYALLAAADHLEGRLPSPWTAQALDLNPGFGDIYAVPAHFYIITRRYTEAVALLERAVALEPEHWNARADLGSNLLRLNRFEEARTQLQNAYAGDPYNAQVVNTLRLLDSMSDFDTLESDQLVLRVHKSETDVLAPYVRELVNRTETEMAARYGYSLERPVVVEIYQHHDDFAVRTAGLPGIGILGAAFGDVVVMDGPSAQGAAEFDWLSALWHELAHVVTLNATNNLVSRWFSEGVSVFEEWRYGPSPNASISLVFLEALSNDRLLSVAELDEGFIRPSYPEQISVSYLQAGLLCEFIADRFETGLVDMLVAYADGATTVEAIEQGLSLTPEKLDELFNDHLTERFGAVVEQLDALQQSMQAASATLKEERWADALASADQAIDIYPEYVGPSSAYLLAVHAAESDESVDKIVDALQRYWRQGGRNPQALGKLARYYHEDGRLDDAVAVQSVLARGAPLVVDHHTTLGDWLSTSSRHAEALSEYRIAFALVPHDKASAHFKLASALHRLDRVEEARRELLYALEIAPRFRPALTLLVEINQ